MKFFTVHKIPDLLSGMSGMSGRELRALKVHTGFTYYMYTYTGMGKLPLIEVIMKSRTNKISVNHVNKHSQKCSENSYAYNVYSKFLIQNVESDYQEINMSFLKHISASSYSRYLDPFNQPEKNLEIWKRHDIPNS